MTEQYKYDPEEVKLRIINASLFDLELSLINFESVLRQNNNLPMLYRNGLNELTSEAHAEQRILEEQFLTLSKLREQLFGYKEIVNNYRKEAERVYGKT